MALIGQRSDPVHHITPHSTFHDAIQPFIRPPNPNSKPTLPALRRRSKKHDPRLEKPTFELSKESAQPVKEELSPRRFDGSSTAVQFKSQAVYYEVKLAEMLSKAKEPRDRPETPGKFSEAPDAYRTSICCQLLTEICKVAAPFIKVLSTIHDELEVAIYSNYVTPSPTTIFEQIPYFELVSSLEKKNCSILKDHEELKVLLAQRQVELEGANVQIEELKQEVTKKDELVTDIQNNLAATNRALEKSSKEVARLAEQIAKNRQEVLWAREIERSLVSILHIE
ncbi:unnamed protein product [Calypogeia fissa]